MKSQFTNYSEFQNYQKRNRLPIILQLGFLAIGALLIVSFALLANNEPKTADALISPISLLAEKPIKKEFSYKLLYADSKKIIYKETAGNTDNLKLVNTATNLSIVLTSGKRIGLIGFLNENNLLFLEDKEGLGRFIVSQYNLVEITTTELLAFQAPKEISLSELDNLIVISPDKTKLAISHESGLVIYTIKSEQEQTVLDNDDCTKSEICLTYHNPVFITDTSLLVFQKASGAQTPILIDSKGTITAVFPANLENLSASGKGLPLVAISEEGLQIVEMKKTTLVLKNDGTKYLQPVWLDKEIAVLSENSGIPTIIKTDKTGKKVLTLKEFSKNTVLGDLITDRASENIYFTETKKTDSNISVSFYKMGLLENTPVSFYTISKNL